MPLQKSHTDLLCSFLSGKMTDQVISRLSLLYDLIVETNERINITSITSPIDVTLKHFLDSLALFYSDDFCRLVAEKKRFCDVGCGGGFPGLPLACVEPEINLTMIDSTEKKINALCDNIKRLGLECVFPIWGRGEELAAKGAKHREAYDVCVSRAVASLPVLCELCLPFVKKGGYFIALKGQKARDELEASKKAIPMLGGKLKEVLPIAFDKTKCDLSAFSEEETEKIESFFEAERYLIIIEKKKDTQSIYPRKWAQMTKKPL